MQVYKRAGFNVRTILMDEEFEKIKDLMPQVVCNTAVAKEHVSKAKWKIPTIKERTQGIIGTLPFEYMLLPICVQFRYANGDPHMRIF